jgi:predicted dehydrogenase
VGASHPLLSVAVIGAGYWGPNLVRNFRACDTTDLRWVCDTDLDRARLAVGPHSTIRVTDDISAVLGDPSVSAIAIATPVSTHLELGLAALQAGKHVLMEKPLAGSVEEGRLLLEEAARVGRVLMCDHTYCYTPAVMKLRQLIRSGEIGALHYIDSVRINLGLVQTDTDVFWDLAPHDLSILDFILPEELWPTAVAAHGADPMHVGRCCIGYLTLPLGGGAIAHIHVNWLSPTKIRTTVVGGSRRTVVWDDLHPSQRISIYDRGIDVAAQVHPNERRDTLVSYRIGDIVAPALPEVEALSAVVREFASAVWEERRALTDGESGLRVLRVLEAASLSLTNGGSLVPLKLGGQRP